MFKRILSITLTTLLMGSGVSGAFAQSKTQSEVDQADRIKSQLTKLGQGRRVKVKLKNNESIKGIIGEIAEDGFTLIDSKQRIVTPIPYIKVQTIRARSSHSGMYPAAFGAAIVGGLLIIAVLL